MQTVEELNECCYSTVIISTGLKNNIIYLWYYYDHQPELNVLFMMSGDWNIDLAVTSFKKTLLNKQIIK